MENTYWDGKGKYQALADQLTAMVPAEGAVKNPRKNAKLDLLRRASNAYHDIFNNGGWNRGAAIRKIFGFSMSHYRVGTTFLWERIHQHTERRMDTIILEAAQEQGLTPVARREDTDVIIDGWTIPANNRWVVRDRAGNFLGMGVYRNDLAEQFPGLVIIDTVDA